MAERSLSELMQDQVKSQEETNAAIKSLNKTFVNYFKVLQRGKLPAEEQRREQDKGLFSRMLGGLSGNLSKQGAEGSSLFGGMFSGIFSSLSGTFGFILKPLRLISKLLIRGGPIGIVIGLMYAVFKDIGDNPQFQKALESLKEIWEKAKTGFTNLKEFITELASKVDLEAAITGITDWLGTLRDNLVDFTATTLANALEIVNNVIDGIGNLFKGDFKAVFDNFKNIAKGLVNIVESFVANVLQTFGIDVEEEGLFARLWDGVKQEVKEKWNAITSTVSSFFTTIKDFFAETIPNTVVEVKNSISNKANELRDTVVNFVTDTWKLIKSYIPNPAEIARSLKDKVMAIAPNWLKDWLADNEPDVIKQYSGRSDIGMTKPESVSLAESYYKGMTGQDLPIVGTTSAKRTIPMTEEDQYNAYARQYGTQVNIGTVDNSNNSSVVSSSGGKTSSDMGRAIDYYHLEKRLGGGFLGYSVSDLRLMR